MSFDPSAATAAYVAGLEADALAKAEATAAIAATDRQAAGLPEAGTRVIEPLALPPGR